MRSVLVAGFKVGSSVTVAVTLEAARAPDVILIMAGDQGYGDTLCMCSGRMPASDRVQRRWKTGKTKGQQKNKHMNQFDYVKG